MEWRRKMKTIILIALFILVGCQHARWVSKDFYPGSTEHAGGMIRYGHLEAAMEEASTWCFPRSYSILKDALYIGTPTTVYIGRFPVTNKNIFKYIEFMCVDHVEVSK
jgi:hypothetical protein